MNLTLHNFRCFDQLDVELGSGACLVGPNGAGKSTVIEAIHWLSVGRSYRTYRDRELIRWQASDSRARLVLDGEASLERTIVLQAGELRSAARRSGVPVRFLESLGLVHVVLFAPELLELVTGSPNLRRRYLDTLLGVSDRGVAQELLAYQHVLRQRNALLAAQPTQTGDRAFAIWEDALARHGRVLIAKRQALASWLAELLPAAYADLAPASGQRQLTVRYRETVVDPDRYEALLAEGRPRDLRLGATSLGPHRDDLELLVDGHPAAHALSRGEQRTLLLALKRAELAFFDSQSAERPPLLLLDDMFSELDTTRASMLRLIVADRPVVLTTTDAAVLDGSLRERLTQIQLTPQHQVVAEATSAT